MISINKAEKESILARYPDTHVVRTMKGDSKRHRYYCTEDRRVINLLKKMREAGELHTEKGRVSNRTKAKRR